MKSYYKKKLLDNTEFTYNDLTSKPSISFTSLVGNMSSRELNMYNIPQVDRLIAKNRPIRVVDHLPSITTPVTTYYVGPTADDYYDIWMFDSDNKPIYLGNTQVRTYSEGIGIHFTDLSKLITRLDVKADNITVHVDSEGYLSTKLVEVGDGAKLRRANKMNIIDLNYDHTTFWVDSEGYLKADSLPKPYDKNSFLGLDENGKVVWKQRILNDVELTGDHNTETANIIWFGSEGTYINSTHRDETLYVVKTSGDNITDSEHKIAHLLYKNLIDLPSIENQTLVDDKSSYALNMYTMPEIDEMLANIRNVKVEKILPAVPDLHTLYYIGTELPYDLYLIDENQDAIYLGTSKEPDYYEDKGILIDSELYVIGLNYDTTLGLNVDSELYAIELVGASEGAPGFHGIVPTPKADEQDAYLVGSGKWEKNPKVLNRVGAIKMFAGKIPPSGWLLCDGSTISREDFKDLFAVIGTNFGAGDGSTTFALPSFVDRYPEMTTIGAMLSPGIPNVTGSVTFGGYAGLDSPSGNARSGCFINMSNSASAGKRAYQNNRSGFSLDASKNTPIYGNSATVQPASVVLNFIIKY